MQLSRGWLSAIASAGLISFSLFAHEAGADQSDKKIRKPPKGVTTGSDGGGVREMGDPLNAHAVEKKEHERFEKEQQTGRWSPEARKKWEAEIKSEAAQNEKPEKPSASEVRERARR